MKKTLIATLLLLLPLASSAAPVAICDPNDPAVEDRVVRFIRAANTPDFTGRTDVVIFDSQPNLGFSWRFAKCAGGNGDDVAYQRVIEMSPQEKRQLKDWRPPEDPNKPVVPPILSGPIASTPTCNDAAVGSIYIARNRRYRADMVLFCIRDEFNRYSWKKATLETP